MASQNDATDAIKAAFVEIGLEPYDFFVVYQPPVEQRLHAGHREEEGSWTITLNNSTAIRVLCERLVAPAGI